jgi:hypothetical protein
VKNLHSSINNVDLAAIPAGKMTCFREALKWEKRKEQ